MRRSGIGYDFPGLEFGVVSARPLHLQSNCTGRLSFRSSLAYMLTVSHLNLFYSCGLWSYSISLDDECATEKADLELLGC